MEKPHPMITVAVLSDTHGLLRPELEDFVRGCDHILHAGDIGNPGILDRLAALAPVTAVRGNVDLGSWAAALPEVARVNLGGFSFLVIHDLARLGIDPEAHGIDAVIYGHSHQPACERRGSVLYLNPGSAGPRRFRLPIAWGRLTLQDTIQVFQTGIGS